MEEAQDSHPSETSKDVSLRMSILSYVYLSSIYQHWIALWVVAQPHRGSEAFSQVATLLVFQLMGAGHDTIQRGVLLMAAAIWSPCCILHCWFALVLVHITDHSFPSSAVGHRAAMERCRPLFHLSYTSTLYEQREEKTQSSLHVQENEPL